MRKENIGRKLRKKRKLGVEDQEKRRHKEGRRRRKRRLQERLSWEAGGWGWGVD